MPKRVTLTDDEIAALKELCGWCGDEGATLADNDTALGDVRAADLRAIAAIFYRAV